jgi:secreted trypsin-like serine protease
VRLRWTWKEAEDEEEAYADDLRARAGEAPWLVSVKRREGRRFFTYCSGALLTKRHVLTAAHCLDGLQRRPHQVFVGVADRDRHRVDQHEQLIAVAEVTLHPDYE